MGNTEFTPLSVLQHLSSGAYIGITKAGYNIRIGKVSHKLNSDVVETLIAVQGVKPELKGDKVNYVLNPNSVKTLLK